MRELITPGRLYNKLCGEFRAVCCAKCSHCILPTPQPFHGGDGTNWVLDTLPRECNECTRIIEDIVKRHQAEYSLMDPFSMPAIEARVALRRFH